MESRGWRELSWSRWNFLDTTTEMGNEEKSLRGDADVGEEKKMLDREARTISHDPQSSFW